MEAIRLPRSEKTVNQKHHKSPGGNAERCVIRNDLKALTVAIPGAGSFNTICPMQKHMNVGKLK